MDTFEKLYDAKEAGGVLGCSRDSVVRLWDRGELEFVEFPRMGGRGLHGKRKATESGLRRFLERHTKRGR
jgi:hypothetical protein